MRKEIIATILVVVGVLALSFFIFRPPPTEPIDPAGLVAGAKDKDADLGLTFDVSPAENAYSDDIVKLTSTTSKPVQNVTFVMARGSCQRLEAITTPPYTVSWTPLSSGCGDGEYSLSATAWHASGKFERLSENLNVRTRLPPPDPIRLSDSALNTESSANTYPPETGTSANQNFARATTQAVNPGTTFRATLNVVGVKTSSGTFNLDYRIWDATDDRILANDALVSPGTATSGSISASFTADEGESHELVFQFKSSELFSAVKLVSYDATIEAVS